MIGVAANPDPGRVLIVDDNEDFAANMADLARIQGLEPTVVRRLAEAMALVERRSFDVALLDYRLPDGAGADFLEHARKFQPNLVTVIITAFATPGTTLAALNRGAFAFVTKDSEPEAFIDALHRAAQNAALRRENQRLQDTQALILAAIPDILILVESAAEAIPGEDGLVALSVNRAHDLFCPDGGADGRLPRPLLDVLSPLVRERLDWKELIAESRAGSEPEPWLRVRDPQGRTRVFAVRCSALDAAPKRLAILRISELTERLDLERRLSESEALAKTGRLVAVIAHEMRNPITGIRALAQILEKRCAADGDDLASVREILQLTTRMSATLADLLSYARPRRWSEESIALDELLAHVVREGRRWPSCEARTLEFEPADSVNPHVRGERDRLASAFSNLIENALHAAPEGGHVLVTLDKTGRVTIEDDGPGIPEEDRERVFEPFFTKKSVGTGLGLAIVREVVQGYGGRLKVSKSARLGGACLTVSLPTETAQSVR